jgi:hypothetical protein
VQGKVAADFVDTGEQSLKNIPRPVRVYRLQLGDTTGAPSLSMSTSPSAPPPETPSLAVLPFQNMSGDSEQEHFCDGLVEDILTTLAKLSGLRVIARNSSFVFKGRAVDVREQLGVRYVLEGSVRRRRPCRKNRKFSGHVLSRGIRSFRVCSCRLDLKPRVIGFMPTPFAAVWNRPQRRCVSSPEPNSAKFNLAQNDGDVDQLYSNSSKVEKFIANGRSTGTHRF